MPSSVQRLLAVAPRLGRADARQPQPDHTTNHRKDGKPQPRKSRSGMVSDRQYQEAKDLNDRYGYVISVDDALVLASDERSPLVIGLDQPIPANDNVKGKRKKTA